VSSRTQKGLRGGAKSNNSIGHDFGVKDAVWMAAVLHLGKSAFSRVRLAAAAFAAAVSVGAGSLARCEPLEPFKPMYRDPRPFLEAIRREKPERKVQASLTGITIPHHLLAADLIARGFWAASATQVERVILLSPDHFLKARRSFATSMRPFRTAFGTLKPDLAAVTTLLADPDLFEDSMLFTQEHGIGAVLPFVARFFPRARIIPIAISVQAARRDWDQAVTRLLPLVGPRTLIIQSTDFSHYLPVHIAQQRDQETLNVLSADSADGVAGLLQSDHLDSKGAQYIQMRLQSLTGSSGPAVIASRNSYQYSSVGGTTTSYIVQLFAAKAMDLGDLHYRDQEVIYFGGDVLLGRYLTQPLLHDEARHAILSEVRRATGGSPLIVNLEGIALDEPPTGLPFDLHVMPSGLAVPILKAMNVTAASLANNHSFDLGPIGLEETISTLMQAGVKPLRHGEIADLGAFRLIALNFISKRQINGFPVVEEGDLAQICRQQARPPLLAFVHWGNEYSTTAGAAQYSTASQLLDCGVTGIIGAHSHRASAGVEAVRGGAQQITFSLGNLLFDQNGSVASGAVLELRVFEQGTFATRLISIPNLYDLGHDELLKRARVRSD
jgi:poly-gamma-glutamate synthesis protein (capsule biosynthesis protein)